jgi:hypothetical protein
MLVLLSLLAAADATQCVNNKGVTSCGDVRSTDVSPFAPSVMDDYRTQGSGLVEAEDTWLFACQNTSVVTVSLSSLDCDVDLFLLPASCDSFDAVASSRANGPADETLRFQCSPGAVFSFVVERVDANPSALTPCSVFQSFDYTLDVACSEVCDNGTDDDGDNLIDCFDPDCPACFETCDNNLDDDFDGLVDCNDPDCAAEAFCCDVDGDGAWSAFGVCGGDDCNDNPIIGGADVYPGAPEVSSNGIDEDCDGLDRTLRIVDFAPGVPGTTNGVSVDGASTQGDVAVFVSLAPGGAVIPGCNVPSALLAPRLYGAGTATDGGTLQVARRVPASLASRQLWLQAYEPDSCAVSEPYLVQLP